MAPRKRLLAIASGGGHWDELMEIRASFDEFEVEFVTTDRNMARVINENIHFIRDCNRRQSLQIFRSFSDTFSVIRRTNPHVVISTGAAPGAIGLLVGKLFGARTVWIDSVAAADKPSLSGKLVRPFVDLHLTQWAHLSGGKVRYMGSVL